VLDRMPHLERRNSAGRRIASALDFNRCTFPNGAV
jgi:hypothetical protein